MPAGGALTEVTTLLAERHPKHAETISYLGGKCTGRASRYRCRHARLCARAPALTSLKRQSTSVANKVLANPFSLLCQSRQHEGVPPSNPGGREGAAGLRERQTHLFKIFMLMN